MYSRLDRVELCDRAWLSLGMARPRSALMTRLWLAPGHCHAAILGLVFNYWRGRRRRQLLRPNGSRWWKFYAEFGPFEVYNSWPG